MSFFDKQQGVQGDWWHSSSPSPLFRYWNEEFLVVLQHNPQQEFNNMFVWGWNQCKNPTFLFR